MDKSVELVPDNQSHTMPKAQQVFEALMRAKGHTEFSMDKGRYKNNSLRVRWSYFHMGWSMREVSS